MSKSQKRILVLLVVLAVGTLGVLAFRENGLISLGGDPGEKQSGYAGRRGESRAQSAQASSRIEYLESAPWMAAGIPMVDRLAAIQQDRSRHYKFFTLPEQIEGLRASLARETYAERQVSNLERIATCQLELGQTEECLETLRKANEIAKTIGIAPGSSMAQTLVWTSGIAYLRQGEQDNCIGGHNADSCLLPIRGGGIYKVTRGPEAAIGAYTEYLRHEPEHLGARWLLNLAYMTIGRWPQDVPKRFLVPPESFSSEYDIKRFVNVAPALGLDTVSISGGAILEDFDRDGFLDLVKSAMGLTDQLLYVHNDGDGTFTNQTVPAGLAGQFGGLNMVHADYNNDGYPDIYITRGAWQQRAGKHPDSLLRNNGPDPKSGMVTFTDVTEQAGLLAFYPSQTAAWGDYNNDGWLDLFVGTEASKAASDYPSLLFVSNGRNRKTGEVTFTEVGQAAGITSRSFVKGSGWGDYDHDGRLDLYISNLEEQNSLYHNDGPGPDGVWRFSDVTAKAGVGLPISSFPTFWFDYDNDGWLDVFSTSRTGSNTTEAEGTNSDPLYMIAAHQLSRTQGMEPPALYRNNHDGTFTNVTEPMGLSRPIYAMGMNFGDLDNDGWLDFYTGTGNPSLSTLVPNLMFRNDEGRRFQDVTYSGGFGNLQKGHGVAWGDVDNDGDQDIYEELGAAWPADVAASALFLNPGHGNDWITVQLVGTKDNRFGIGSRIKVTLETEDGRTRDIYVTAGSGGSFGCNSMQQEMGLGKAKRIVSLIVEWLASGKSQIFTDVPMNRVVRITQDSPELKVVRTQRVPMPSAEEAMSVLHHHEPVVIR